MGGATVVRHMLTKTIGVRAEVEFEVTERDLEVGEMVLLCSDGLTDNTILDIVSGNAGHLEKACETLVARANEQGGRDNISVILFRFSLGAPESSPTVER